MTGRHVEKEILVANKDCFIHRVTNLAFTTRLCAIIGWRMYNIKQEIGTGNDLGNTE